MLHEGTVRASRSLREAFAKTLRQAGFKRSSRLLREGFAEPPRCLSGESPSRRHRDVFAVPSRRHHYGGFMNPSFEAFVDPPDGFHEKPGIRSNREGQLSSPEARMVVEPRMQLLGLCSFDARRKSRLLVLGAKKRRFFGAPKKKKSRRKIFLGGRKSYLAAEHHNEAAPKKKIKEVFPLRRRKILLLSRKSRFLVLGAEKQKSRRKTKIGGRKNFGEAEIFWGGVEKVIWPLNTITRRRRKK